MTESDDIKKEDEVINVTLPSRDYALLRELIDERRAMTTFKRWIQMSLIVIVGSVAVKVFGLFELMKRFL